jgi:ribosomal-protein-alanine N-acetyltransferase
MEIKDIFGELPRLETNRLILRKIDLDDASDLFEYAQEPEITRYVTWQPHKTIEDSKEFLKTVIQKYKDGKVSIWGIVYKGDKKLIGTCGYLWWFPAHSRAEIAYALSRSYWNKGLMTEVVREVIRFGFVEMKLNRVEARCVVGNIASEKVLKKAGMQFEGIIREQMFFKEAYQDLKLYSILRSEYNEKYG